MFDLEKAIEQWRKEMRRAGIKNNALDELEGHLREDVENQIKRGMEAAQAFAMADERFGQPAALQKEFAKAGARKRTLWQRFYSAFLNFSGGPMLQPASFTVAAQEALQLGGKEAVSFHHDFIGTEHVLLGLLDLETGVARNVLQKLGVDAGIVRKKIEEIIGVGPDFGAKQNLPYTPSAKKALEIARTEAKALNHSQVGAEHIFLGLLLEGSGVAALVLKALRVDVQSAREEIRRELGENPGGA